MFRRTLPCLALALTATALAVPPAFAGEDGDDPQPPPATQPAPLPAPVPVDQQPGPDPAPDTPASALRGSATLRSSQGCLSGSRTIASVRGSRISFVVFFVDGRRVETVRAPDASGRFALTMSCATLSPGTHRGRAAVTFQDRVRPQHRDLAFQVTRTQQVRPQFTG